MVARGCEEGKGRGSVEGHGGHMAPSGDGLHNGVNILNITAHLQTVNFYIMSFACIKEKEYRAATSVNSSTSVCLRRLEP